MKAGMHASLGMGKTIAHLIQLARSVHVVYRVFKRQVSLKNAMLLFGVPMAMQVFFHLLGWNAILTTTFGVLFGQGGTQYALLGVFRASLTLADNSRFVPVDNLPPVINETVIVNGQPSFMPSSMGVKLPTNGLDLATIDKNPALQRLVATLADNRVHTSQRRVMDLSGHLSGTHFEWHFPTHSSGGALKWVVSGF